MADKYDDPIANAKDEKEAEDAMPGTSRPLIVPKMLYEAGKVEAKKIGRNLTARYKEWR